MARIQDVPFLPASAGCYLFKDAQGTIIYVGKAKNLKKRVTSYFQRKDLDPKTAILVSNIHDFDFILTPSEVEALLLENSLIKKYYPHYNLDLKDSHRYAYLLLHDDSLPWIEVVRKRESKGEYYGPFISGFMRKIIMDVITRNFRLLTRKPSPQLRKTIDKDAYAQRVNQVRKILKGDVDELINQLQQQMNVSSQKTFYEHALNVRTQISALKTLKERQIIELTRTVDAHVINYLVIGGEVFLLVFTLRKGVLEDKQSYSFTYYEEFLDDFLLQYYDQAPIPSEIILPQRVDPAFTTYLTKKAGRNVRIAVPQKGKRKELLQLVFTNISPTFFAGSEQMKQLQKALSLPKLPQLIECFDISHLSGTNTVASMVSFTNGLPDKSRYRKFKIRSVTQSDDYAAMREVIERRYAGSLSKSLKKPDLIVIDGGLGQLSAACEVLRQLHVKVPTIALAKKLEEIYQPGSQRPLILDRKNKGLQLLQAIRDEAHRFAISYERLLHIKKVRE